MNSLLRFACECCFCLTLPLFQQMNFLLLLWFSLPSHCEEESCEGPSIQTCLYNNSSINVFMYRISEFKCIIKIKISPSKNYSDNTNLFASVTKHSITNLSEFFLCKCCFVLFFSPSSSQYWKIEACSVPSLENSRGSLVPAESEKVLHITGRK